MWQKKKFEKVQFFFFKILPPPLHLAFSQSAMELRYHYHNYFITSLSGHKTIRSSVKEEHLHTLYENFKFYHVLIRKYNWSIMIIIIINRHAPKIQGVVQILFIASTRHNLRIIDYKLYLKDLASRFRISWYWNIFRFWFIISESSSRIYPGPGEEDNFNRLGTNKKINDTMYATSFLCWLSCTISNTPRTLYI